MKKQYNNKYRTYNDCLNEISQLENDIEVVQNRIAKLNFKKTNILSLVDHDFYNQYEENLNRMPKELISFMFEFFGYSNHHYNSVKVISYY